MATGESFRSLAFQYRITHSWISCIVRQVLASICTILLDVYMPQPTEERLRHIASGFLKRWNYPNCCGAIDGKHIRIRCPAKSGSLFFNYKTFYSIVMLAIVDADCKFVCVDVGSYGREGDAAIYAKSAFGKQINAGKFNMPRPTVIPGTSIIQPHVIIGDEAFALTENMMKPYPKVQSLNDDTIAVYNYRHCRARRTTENAFGIMCQYFRVLFTPIATQPETTDNVIIAACILHNLLRSSNIPYPGESKQTEAPSLPKDTFISLAPASNRQGTFCARQVRDTFKTYFNSKEGTVEWQNRHINRTN